MKNRKIKKAIPRRGLLCFDDIGSKNFLYRKRGKNFHLHFIKGNGKGVVHVIEKKGGILFSSIFQNGVNPLLNGTLHFSDDFKWN